MPRRSTLDNFFLWMVSRWLLSTAGRAERRRLSRSFVRSGESDGCWCQLRAALGIAWRDLGLPVKARESYRRAAEKDPSQLAWWFNLSLLGFAD